MESDAHLSTSQHCKFTVEPGVKNKNIHIVYEKKWPVSQSSGW